MPPPRSHYTLGIRAGVAPLGHSLAPRVIRAYNGLWPCANVHLARPGVMDEPRQRQWGEAALQPPGACPRVKPSSAYIFRTGLVGSMPV